LSSPPANQRFCLRFFVRTFAAPYKCALSSFSSPTTRTYSDVPSRYPICGLVQRCCCGDTSTYERAEPPYLLGLHQKERICAALVSQPSHWHSTNQATLTLVQIQLMILLHIKSLLRRNNLRRDGALPQLLHQVSGFLRFLFLSRSICIICASVLRAHVRTLAIGGSGELLVS
jgi:hypothetical protein